VTPSQEQKVAGTSDQKAEVKMTVIIQITDGQQFVNLYRQPSSESEVISKANYGERFELVSELPGWYEIKLNDSRNAFVSRIYSEKVMEEIQ
jgi:N-acetylmuramoyl-L-alanine amidase